VSAPESLDLTAAALATLGAYSDQAEGAREVWQALTGISDEPEALAYARQVAGTVPPVTAHVPPM
jgi:hypothetical protein